MVLIGTASVTCELPHESELSPLLFIVYVTVMEFTAKFELEENATLCSGVSSSINL